MWTAGSGFSIELDSAVAARKAAEQAVSAAGGADAAIVFVGPGQRAELPRTAAMLRDVLGTSRVVGALAHGVLGAGHEAERGAGVSVLAIRGLEVETLWVPDLEGREDDVADAVSACLGGDARAEDLVVLMPDPAALQPGALFDALRDVTGEAQVVGAGAGDPVSGAPLLWCGDEMSGGALTGVVLRGARATRIGVTQACRPVTKPMRITRCEGPWVVELDGRPALDVYREAAREPLAEDLERAAAFVLVALPGEVDAPLEPGSYRVRNVAGFAPDAGAFAVAEQIERGDALAFVHREPLGARDDLKAMLDRLGPEPAGLGLYFDCCARGAGFFGVPGLESAYLSRALGETPVAGMFGSCEIGPIAGRTELLTYTGVLALLDR